MKQHGLDKLAVKLSKKAVEEMNRNMRWACENYRKFEDMKFTPDEDGIYRVKLVVEGGFRP